MTEIAVSGLVLDQKHKVTALRIKLMLAIKPRTRRHVNLAADYRLYSGLLAGMVKLNCAVHYSVISQSNGFMSGCRRRFRYILYSARTVQQTVFTVKMQMNKS